MTIREKVICECFTGVCFCVGEERDEIYKYLGELFGRPIQTLEIPTLSEEIKNRSYGDFIRVCAGEYADVQPREYIYGFHTTSLIDEIRGLVDGALHNVEKISGEQEVKENEID